MREFLEDTPFAASEVVTVSARDGRGLDDLLAALERAAEHAEAGRHAGPARLPVDRVFPLKGIGTVVTGTLWSGEIRAGDAMVVAPGGAQAGVRSVQVHDHETEVVHAGSRVGVEPPRPRSRRHPPRRLAGGARARRALRAPLRRLGLGAAGGQAAALRRPGATPPRHGAVPRPSGAARRPRDRPGDGRRRGRPAGRRRARPAARPVHRPHAVAGRDHGRRRGAARRRAALARARAARRVPRRRARRRRARGRSSRWRRTAGTPG